MEFSIQEIRTWCLRADTHGSTHLSELCLSRRCEGALQGHTSWRQQCLHRSRAACEVYSVCFETIRDGWWLLRRRAARARCKQRTLSWVKHGEGAEPSQPRGAQPTPALCRLQVGTRQPGDGRAAAEAGGVSQPAGQLPGGRGAAAAMADGEGADDECAGTPLHRPQHAERTEAAGPGELVLPHGLGVKKEVLLVVHRVEDGTPS